MILQYRVTDNKKDEMLDIVDANDNIIGTESKTDYLNSDFLKTKRYARMVTCFIVNSDNKIWTPIRNSKRLPFPNSLDFSCGGYVPAGLNYKKALILGLEEENNIKVKPIELKLIGKMNPLNNLVSAFMEIYKYVSDTDIEFNPEYFSAAEWLTKEELANKILTGNPAKIDLLPTLLKFQDSI